MTGSRVYRVRCYFISAANELLAIESRHMCCRAAKRLVQYAKRPDSECLDTDMSHINRRLGVQPGARVVDRLFGPAGIERNEP